MNHFNNFYGITGKQFGKSVKTVRSDNGTEFMCFSSYFRENRIIHQPSCVRTPQQNGSVERKYRHILNVARALLFQANLPIKFGVGGGGGGVGGGMYWAHPRNFG